MGWSTPRRRSASTARRPPSEAPTTTIGSWGANRPASGFDLDRAGRALSLGALDLRAECLRGRLVQDVEESVVPDLEDFRGRFRAEPVALADIEIDNNFHGF